MYKIKCLRLVACFALTGFTSMAIAQSASVSDETANIGATEVTVDWNYTAGGAVEGAGIDVTYNDTLLTPQTTAGDVDGCLAGVDTALQSCQTIAADTIRITFQNLGSTIETDQSGTMTFDIASGAVAGDSSALTLEVASVTPNTETIGLTDGSVEIVSGPQSELTLTPTAIDFMVVDLGNMPQTGTFTLENDGDTGTTININSVTYSGDGEFTIQNNGCASAALAAGDTCDIVIEFNAAANGTYAGQIDVTSDADTNPNPTGTIDGEADSVANLTVNPPFGPVPLGTVVVGQSTTANGSVTNSGSAGGNFSCALTGDTAVISTTPDLSSSIPVPAGGSVDFSLTCAIPETAVEGDTFNATLTCSGDLDGVHDISCDATEFVPFPVPTMNKIGLGILALLMVMIGGLMVRFFRT